MVLSRAEGPAGAREERVRAAARTTSCPASHPDAPFPISGLVDLYSRPGVQTPCGHMCRQCLVSTPVPEATASSGMMRYRFRVRRFAVVTVRLSSVVTLRRSRSGVIHISGEDVVDGFGEGRRGTGSRGRRTGGQDSGGVCGRSAHHRSGRATHRHFRAHLDTDTHSGRGHPVSRQRARGRRTVSRRTVGHPAVSWRPGAGWRAVACWWHCRALVRRTGRPR